MKNPKPYLLIIFLAMLCTSASAQLINGRFYRFLQGPQAYDYGRFKTELVPPYQLSAEADTGSIAFNNNKWYGKKTDSTWVEIGSGVDPVLQTFTSVTTDSYTIPDSVNSVIVDYSGDATVNLPTALSSDKREITIRNAGSGTVYFNYAVKYSTTLSSAVLATGKSIKIKSDGADWNVIQDNSSTSSGGGGSSKIPVVDF